MPTWLLSRRECGHGQLHHDSNQDQANDHDDGNRGRGNDHHHGYDDDRHQRHGHHHNSHTHHHGHGQHDDRHQHHGHNHNQTTTARATISEVAVPNRQLSGTEMDCFGACTGRLNFWQISVVSGNFTMARLERVGGKVYFGACKEMTAVAFPRLATITGSFNVDRNPDLVSLSFPRLVETGGLILYGNRKLTTLDFGSIERIGVSAASGNYLGISRNGPQPVSSPACRRIKNACSGVAACKGNSLNSDNKGPNLNTCNQGPCRPRGRHSPHALTAPLSRYVASYDRKHLHE